jgi:RNA polymerase sigma factor (sigma-70 family)
MAASVKTPPLVRGLRAMKLKLGDPLDDRQLLAEFVRHEDQAAFAELVRRHASLVWTVCRRVLPASPDAEDALQVTFLVLAQKARGIKQPERLTNWLYGVALRSAKRIKLMNTRQRRGERLRPPPNVDSAASAIESDDIEILDQELNKLPAHYREAVLLCELQGLSRKVAGARLGIAEGTLSSRLAMARKKLAKSLAGRGVTLGVLAGAAAGGGVSAALVDKIADGATAMLRGDAAALSPHLLHAAEGVIKSMIVAKLKPLAGVLAALCGILIAGASLLWPSAQAPAEDQPTAPKVVVADEAKAPTGFLTGRVVDPDGKPLAGARVWLRSHGKTPDAETTTDGAGKYRLGPVRAAVSGRGADLFVEAPGFARQYVASPLVYPGSDRDGNEIALTRGQRVRGQLIDIDGKPRAGTMVEIQLSRHYLGHTTLDLGEPYCLTTDAEGRFESPPLPLATGTIFARIPERVNVHENLELKPGKDQDIRVTLKRDKPIVIRVETEDGKPIVGARLGGVWKYDNLVSDAKGIIEMRGMESLPQVLFRLNAEDYPQVDVVLDKFDTKIVLKKPAYLCGKAIDADTGEPVQISQIVICQLRKKSDGKIEPFG